ncbi:MAG: T9SS type A sorting domain-containing protein [Flavobacteriales bacterium]|nr:T9SS type A sorting domain-containing protein [Flavobacteriales bacterium]MCX7769097.1 T9SS type A sorting domain-containing protein [Flavobacteriales bacterium]
MEDPAQAYHKLATFPNPASHQLQISLIAAAKAHNASAQVINASGQTVDAFTVALQEGTNTFTYDCSGLAPGFYILKIGPVATRFVVTR